MLQNQQRDKIFSPPHHHPLSTTVMSAVVSGGRLDSHTALQKAAVHTARSIYTAHFHIHYTYHMFAMVPANHTFHSQHTLRNIACLKHHSSDSGFIQRPSVRIISTRPRNIPRQREHTDVRVARAEGQQGINHRLGSMWLPERAT